MALEWRHVSGAALGDPVRSGALHAVLGEGKIGGPTEEVTLALYNPSATKTVSAVKVWTSFGDGGGALAIALGTDGVRSPGGTEPIGGTPGSYSTPTTKATGLSVASLGPGQVVGIWVRRTLTGATALSPELNRLHAAGTEPI